MFVQLPWPLVSALLVVVASDISAADDIFELNAQPTLVLAEGTGEGPAWHPQYGLFFSGGRGITLLDRNGDSQLFLPDAGSNGLLFDHQGRLLICQPAQRRVSRMNVGDGTLAVLTDNYQGKRYNQPNDITVDSQGRIYFSDPRYGKRDGMELVDATGRDIEGVYRIDLDGKVIPRDEVTNCTFGGPNLRTLYVTAGGTLWSIRTTTPGKMPWPK